MELFTIRLDDITPDMNWENFRRIKDILDQYNVKPLLGVVPDNQDKMLHISEGKEDFFAYVRELQEEGYVIAQHGYRHIYETKDRGLLGLNAFSEFAGLPYEVQLKKIEDGKRILQENKINTNIFMAPGHSYDKNTITALKKAGFQYVTDGFYHKPYRYDGLVFFSCTMLDGYKGKGVNTLCFHLNRKSDREIKGFEQFIRQNRDKIVDFDCEKLKEKAVKRSLGVWLAEKKFLFTCRVKGKLSSNKAVAEYMVLTNAKNPVVKLLKRIVFLPVLPVKLLKAKK